jgi:Cdc6-like AAA superfamily ATPase
MNLFAGIKAFRRARLFLVIGDPGSGKSVALRELCRDLLEKTSQARLPLPVYLNLREWVPETRWSKEHPPTEEDLRAFVLNSV